MTQRRLISLFIVLVLALAATSFITRSAKCTGYGCSGGVCPCVFPCQCFNNGTGPGVCVAPPRPFQSP